MFNGFSGGAELLFNKIKKRDVVLDANEIRKLMFKLFIFLNVLKVNMIFR